MREEMQQLGSCWWTSTSESSARAAVRRRCPEVSCPEVSCPEGATHHAQGSLIALATSPAVRRDPSRVTMSTACVWQAAVRAALIVLRMPAVLERRVVVQARLAPIDPCVRLLQLPLRATEGAS